MKVYCTECKWYIDGFCMSPKNMIEKDSWARRIAMLTMPWDKNAKNDCDWYEEEKS